MGRNSDLRYIGSNGNLVYDIRRNVYFEILADPPLKKVSKKEKENRNLKEGNFEFGGGAVLSKAFRDAFASVLAEYPDRGLAGKLTGIFRRMIKNGSGKEGMRRAEIRKNKRLLEGFEFHKRNVFRYILPQPLTWEVKKGRKEIVLRFPVKGTIGNPKGATHFQITVFTAALPDHHYSKGKKKYLPLAVTDGQVSIHSSALIPLHVKSEEVQIRITHKADLPDTCALVVCTGIQFHKQEGKRMSSLQTNKALQVSKIF